MHFEPFDTNTDCRGRISIERKNYGTEEDTFCLYRKHLPKCNGGGDDGTHRRKE